MHTFTYAPGEYNAAAGTRDAFGGLSDALVAEGYPAMRSVSADRETSTQVAIFVDRYRQQATGTGRFGDVRYWDGTAYGYPGGTRWVRVSDEGTVAVPTTSNHEKRRVNDLAWPYNSDTPAHRRARQLAVNYNIECDGISFGEWWHWSFWGALGVIGTPAGGGATAFNPEEDDMTAQQYADLMWEMECARPIKLYALVDASGAGGWVWVGPSGRYWIVPSGDYAALVAGEKLSQSRPIRAIQANELDFIAKQLLGGLVPDSRVDVKPETQLEQILTLSQDTVRQIVAGIGELPVALTQVQLDAIAKAAATGAQTGGETGARTAIAGLSFVTTIS